MLECAGALQTKMIDEDVRVIARLETRGACLGKRYRGRGEEGGGMSSI